jgi:capsular polysaccharide biosynthesis protein
VQELNRNLYVLRRWWWLLLAAAIVGGLIAYLATKLLVHQQYQAIAVISMAPPPQPSSGLYLTTLSASADSALVPTLRTAQAALASSPKLATSVTPLQLAHSTTASASPEGQLLTVTVLRPDSASAVSLANAMAGAFIAQERSRLQQRYVLLHRGLVSKEQFLAARVKRGVGGGAPMTWLQAQYADTYSRVFQQDADARVQADLQKTSLQMAQPADPSTVGAIGPRSSFNGVLGAILGLLLALVVAYVATGSYGEYEDASARQPVLTRVRD